MTPPSHPVLIVMAGAALPERLYWTRHDTWSADPGEGEVLTDEAHAQLRLLDAQLAASPQAVDFVAAPPQPRLPHPSR